MKKFKRNCLSVFVCLCSSAVIGSDLIGENTENSNRFELEEILVTAEKIGAKSVMDTAFSLTAVSGKELEAKGVTTIADALAVNPGVSSFDFGAANYLQIRGVSSVTGDATVGYYLDDLPLTLVGIPYLPDLNPYDLSSLEVLRGPQGTLYGASSQGGTVRVLTQDPEHQDLYGKINLGFSSSENGENSWKAQMAINLPIIDNTLSARVVASRIDKGGFIDLPLADEENYNDAVDENLRLKLRFTPTDNLEFGLSVWSSEKSTGFSYADENYDYSPIYLTLDSTELFLNNSIVPVGSTPVGSEGFRQNNDLDLYNFKVTYDFGEYSLVSSTSFLKLKQNLNQDYLTIALVTDMETSSLVEELRLSFAGEQLSWAAGFFYLDNELELSSQQGFGLDVAPNPREGLFELFSRESISEQWALFGEIGYQLDEEWKLTLGLRYFEDERSEETLTESLVTGLNALAIGPIWEEGFEKTTGRLNISYTPEEDELYYMNIAQGFRPGAANGGFTMVSASLVGIDTPLFTESEELTSIEIGTKQTFLEGDVAVELALYYMKWDEIITLLTSVSPLTNTVVGYNQNAGEAEGQGIDIGIAYRMTDQLIINFSGNYNSTEYGESIVEANLFEGDQVIQVPELTFNVSANYFWPVSSSMDGSFTMNYNYTDSRVDYAFAAPTYESDSFATLSARIGVQSDRWSIYLTGENLTGEDGEISQLAALAASVPPSRLRPRTVGVEFNINFN